MSLSAASDSDVFPYPFPDGTDVRARLAWLRRHAPVSRVRLRDGHRAWLVTRYRDVRAVFADNRFAAAPPGGPKLVYDLHPPDVVGPVMSNPPRHAVLRGLVAPPFSAGKIAARAHLVQTEVDALVDAMAAAGPPADLYRDFAQQLPVAVGRAWIGMGDVDRGEMLSWVDEALGPLTAEQMARVGERLRRYAAERLATPLSGPGSDTWNALATTSGLTEGERLGVALVLLFNGVGTVSSLIAQGLWALLRERSHWNRLRAHPAEIPAAVSELIRHIELFKDGFLRIAKVDAEVGGTRIAAGDPVVASLTSANHDETVFPDADSLDLRRARNPHLTFGHGIHRCPAAHLIPAEFATALTTLLRRFPDLRPADLSAEPGWRARPRLLAPSALPVVW